MSRIRLIRSTVGIDFSTAGYKIEILYQNYEDGIYTYEAKLSANAAKKLLINALENNGFAVIE